MNYMTVTAAPTESETQRSYLVDRLRTAFRTKDAALERKFGLRDDEEPRTFDEMIQRIKDGKYRLADGYKSDQKLWEGPQYYIRWRSVDKDQAGYDAAETILKTAYQAAMDIIKVKSLDDGLVALQAFEKNA